MKHTVKELRQSGYSVRVTHKRLHPEFQFPVTKFMVEDSGRTMENVLPFGGITIVQITRPDGQLRIGEAVCSKKDQFNRKLGRTIALNRAMSRF